MNFLNISSFVDGDPLFIAATFEQRSIWLILQCESSKNDTNGEIPCIKSWSDKVFSQKGINREVLFQPSPLWHFQGEILIIRLWNKYAQEKFLKKKAHAAEWGQMGGKKKHENAQKKQYELNGEKAAYLKVEHKVDKSLPKARAKGKPKGKA